MIRIPIEGHVVKKCVIAPESELVALPLGENRMLETRPIRRVGG